MGPKQGAPKNPYDSSTSVRGTSTSASWEPAATTREGSGGFFMTESTASGKDRLSHIKAAHMLPEVQWHGR